MPLSVYIDAPIADVYNVLNNPELNAEWNPVTEGVTQTGHNPITCEVESFLGTFTTTRAVTKLNTQVTFDIQGSPLLQQISYVLVELSPTQTRVDGSVEFVDGREYKILHRSVGRAMLDNLKRYVEYISTGGQAANFQKQP